jgi:hypothetical protein
MAEVFRGSSPAKFRDSALKSAVTTFFHITSKSSFTNNPIIRRYMNYNYNNDDVDVDSYLFACQLNSPRANYKVSTNEQNKAK